MSEETGVATAPTPPVPPRPMAMAVVRNLHIFRRIGSVSPCPLASRVRMLTDSVATANCTASVEQFHARLWPNNEHRP